MEDLKCVSEIFGFPSSNKTQEATVFRQNFQCPFQKTKAGFNPCDPINKKSNLVDENGKLLLTHQTGACSVYYTFKKQVNTPVIICPYRFLERGPDNRIKIFKYIAEKFFPKKYIVFVPEIGLGPYGRADWMVCEITKTKDSPIQVVDFAHLEFQSDATTGTRNLVLCVKDFFEGKDIVRRKYNYGLNSKASVKGSSLQMIDKGFLFQKLGKKSIWVLQDTLFTILSNIFNIQMNDITESKVFPTVDNLIYVVVSLVKNPSTNRNELNVTKCFSTSASSLQKAMMDKKVELDIFASDIYKSLKDKIEGGKYFELRA
jgi:hypothetical protein